MDSWEQILVQFEDNFEDHDKFSVDNATIESLDEDVLIDAKYEMIAFDLYEDVQGSGTIWDTYYGPVFSGSDSQGNLVSAPCFPISQKRP